MSRSQDGHREYMKQVYLLCPISVSLGLLRRKPAARLSGSTPHTSTVIPGERSVCGQAATCPSFDHCAPTVTLLIKTTAHKVGNYFSDLLIITELHCLLLTTVVDQILPTSCYSSFFGASWVNTTIQTIAPPTQTSPVLCAR